MEIRFRIVDDLNQLKSATAQEFDRDIRQISGFFQILFDGHCEGGCYYHERPMQDGEYVGELIDYWFDCLIDTVYYLLWGNTDYVAFWEIDTYKRWIEVRRNKNLLKINVADLSHKKFEKLFMLEDEGRFTYVEPLDYTIMFEEFRKEVVDKTKLFLENLNSINPNLSESKHIIAMREKLCQIDRCNAK